MGKRGRGRGGGGGGGGGKGGRGREACCDDGYSWALPDCRTLRAMTVVTKPTITTASSTAGISAARSIH